MTLVLQPTDHELGGGALIPAVAAGVLHLGLHEFDEVFIIQQVDKKLPLETIAKSKDLRFDQLLKEMETIVASGTKLNLDYAINQMVDEDDQLDILDYFKSCETSDLQVAQDELSDLSLEWEQLMIMRIKFLSVYGM